MGSIQMVFCSWGKEVKFMFLTHSQDSWTTSPHGSPGQPARPSTGCIYRTRDKGQRLLYCGCREWILKVEQKPGFIHSSACRMLVYIEVSSETAWLYLLPHCLATSLTDILCKHKHAGSDRLFLQTPVISAEKAQKSLLFPVGCQGMYFCNRAGLLMQQSVSLDCEKWDCLSPSLLCWSECRCNNSVTTQLHCSWWLVIHPWLFYVSQDEPLQADNETAILRRVHIDALCLPALK